MTTALPVDRRQLLQETGLAERLDAATPAGEPVTFAAALALRAVAAVRDRHRRVSDDPAWVVHSRALWVSTNAVLTCSVSPDRPATSRSNLAATRPRHAPSHPHHRPSHASDPHPACRHASP